MNAVKWIALACLLLAGCLTAPTPDLANTEAPVTEVCDEDHLRMFIVPQDWGTNETLVEENGLNVLSIYRFQCGDEIRELWGLELESKTFTHERWLLKQCGWYDTCKTSADFKVDGDVLLEQYTMVLMDSHVITTKVVKGGDKFPGYTSLWKMNDATWKTTHSIGTEIGSGTFMITPLPLEHYGIIGSPENFVHMVADVTLTIEKLPPTATA